MTEYIDLLNSELKQLITSQEISQNVIDDLLREFKEVVNSKTYFNDQLNTQMNTT